MEVTSYEQWLDIIEKPFYENIDAELDAMATYYLEDENV